MLLQSTEHNTYGNGLRNVPSQESPKKMSRPAIVFDLDGTLADTAADLIDSLNHCLASEGLAPVARADIVGYVGHGGRFMISKVHEDRGIDLPEDRLDLLVDIFLDHYRQNIPGSSRPFQGAVECIRAFREGGFATAICTNKYEELSVSLIDGLGLASLFDANCGSDTFTFRKPDPRHLIETILKAGAEPTRSLMIGDSQTDILTAKAADIPVVAVDFGYSPEPVRTYGPDRVISHFSELTPALAEKLIGKN